MSKIDEIYEEILEQIGNNGRFQKTFNYLFNFGFTALSTAAAYNYYLFLTVPDHWCSGPESGNMSLTSWKEEFIPKIYNNESGLDEYEKCSMFINGTRNVSKCLYGWQYDTTWFDSTIPSDQNWVCENDLKVTTAYTYIKIGEVLDTLIFGQLGDRLGRRSILYYATTLLLLGKLLLTFTSNSFILFGLALLLSSFCTGSVFQSPMIIGMEISSPEHRSTISLLQCLGWTTGLALLPIIYWYFRKWLPFLLASTLPILPFLFITKYMIESPRWLLNKGDIKKSTKMLRKIAKVNGTTLDEILLQKLDNAEVDEEMDNHNFLNLFASRTMTKYTILTTIGWISYMSIDNIVYQNLTNFSGNPYTNFFVQALAELPGYILGKYSTDYFGRKRTRAFSFALAALASIIIVFFINHPQYSGVVTASSTVLKFSTSVVSFVIYLHSIETFPTNIRQTGIFTAALIGNIAGLGVPYLIYLGTKYDLGIPYVASTIFALSGLIGSLFLPETKGAKLPETLQDVENLSKSFKPSEATDEEHYKVVDTDFNSSRE